MELVAEITLIKKDIDDEGLNRDTIRAEEKERIVEVLNPLLKEGWDIHITSTRINR